MIHSLWCVHWEGTSDIWTQKLQKSAHDKAQEDKYTVLLYLSKFQVNTLDLQNENYPLSAGFLD